MSSCLKPSSKVLVIDIVHLMLCSFVCKREKNSVVASQRRLERKLKELNMTLDEERQSHTDQKDQVFAAALSQVSTSEQGGEGMCRHQTEPLTPITFCSSL